MISALADYRGDSPAAFLLLAAALAGFVAMGVRLSIIDARTHRLPNRMVLPCYPIAAVLLAGAALMAGEPHRVVSMAGGAAVLWVAYLALHLVPSAGLGFGDVKLGGLLGLYLGFGGWQLVVAGAAAGFVLGGLWSLLLVSGKRAGWHASVPFGPFLIGGAAIALAALG
ncbi:leader peptidase (prepilin peptidase)/N-methyltransferase [Arthrobacter sp. CAN_A214]|uniref:prepilin peptidase n=1 Tax=Arthrobacter sp. CAN_A214 TaxID=2787720 RepID=UPI001A1A79A9